MTALQEFDEFALRPLSETGPGIAAQVRRRPGIEQCAAQISGAAFVERLLLKGYATRRVTGAAMS